MVFGGDGKGDSSSEPVASAAELQRHIGGTSVDNIDDLPEHLRSIVALGR